MPGGRRKRVHPVAVIFWAVFLAALVFVPGLVEDEAALRRGLAALGPLAWLGYLAAEVVQVLIIPIPGQPFEVTGGWMFGLTGGVLLGSAGAFAGSLAAFALGRRYGRPWVAAKVRPELRAKFAARLAGGGATWIVLGLMLVPAFPRDPLCYLAGLTGMSGWRFAAIAAVGRPAGLVPWVALGAEGVALGLGLQLVLAAPLAAVWLARAAQLRLRAAQAVAAGP